MFERSAGSSAVAMSPAEGDQFVTISPMQLRTEAMLRFPVYDSQGTLLLNHGATVTTSIVENLIRRGITKIQVHTQDVRRSGESGRGAPSGTRPGANSPQPVARGKSKSALARNASLSSSRHEKPVCQRVRNHQAQPYESGLVQNYTAQREQSVAHVERMFRTLDRVSREQVDCMEAVTHESLMRMVDDMDLFVRLGIQPGNDKYPARHSTQTSMLAMAVGTRMGLDQRRIMELGMGCLAHDAGMLHLKKPVYEEGAILDRLAFLEITKHSSMTFDLMSDVDHLAGCSRLVAFQMHERCDGSGYPRRRLGNQIHPLSKIAAVSDVFVALVSPRPYRPAMLPYHAAECILRGAEQGKFDPAAVRGLLETVSLFPLGSCVELSDGRVGRVLRSNGKSFARPVLEVWRLRELLEDPEVLDLATRDDLHIVRPLQDLAPTQELSYLIGWE